MAGSFIDDPWLAQCFQDSNAQFVPPEQPLINDVRIRRRIRTHPSAIVLPKGSGRTFEADGDGDYVIPAVSLDINSRFAGSLMAVFASHSSREKLSSSPPSSGSWSTRIQDLRVEPLS